MRFTRELKVTIGCWIFVILVPIIVILPVYFCTDFGLSNICAILGVLFLFYIAIRAVERGGVFDVFNYQFIRFKDSFRKGSPKEYEDAYAYKEAMISKRHDNKMIWIPFLVSGLILVGLAILFAFYPI